MVSWCPPLNEQIPDWCEATLADDSHAVLMRHDLADFFQLCFGHDDSLVVLLDESCAVPHFDCAAHA